MIENILTSPPWLILATIVLWIILYYTLMKLFKISETNWKRLEYLWICTGFLGLITIVLENKNLFNKSEVIRIENSIHYGVKQIEYTLSGLQTCMKFNKSELSPVDFDARQIDQDLICNWSKSYIIEKDSSSGLPINSLKLISKTSLPLTTDQMDRYIEEFNITVTQVNKDINAYKTLQSEINSNKWNDFVRTFGALFVIIAFSTRLAIATKNVSQS